MSLVIREMHIKTKSNQFMAKTKITDTKLNVGGDIEQ